MVSRGRRSFNRSRHEEEKKDEEEEQVNLQNAISAEEAARIRRAQSLAEEALRMAAEARKAAQRLREYRARISLPYRRSMMLKMDESSTMRQGDDACRTL
mmetsp:Transcript_8234/g.17067  ORF Transcript_8234/g.17067 Transcript_8234/m.17067 type:complete len:100 (+) Transcript_8234:100-399(+)